MGAAFAFGLGFVAGGLLTWKAGGSYVLWKQAHDIASDYEGVARKRRSTMFSSVGMLAMVVVGGLLIMFFS